MNHVLKRYGLLMASFIFMGKLGSAAEVGDISCKARYHLVTEVGTFYEKTVPLKTNIRNERQIQLEAEVEGRTMILNGDLRLQDYSWSLIWGPDYTEGIRAKGSFDSSGFLALFSVATVPVELKDFPSVKKGSAVYRLECTKTLASQ